MGIWYKRNGQPRWFKPSRFPNPVSWLVNRHLFAGDFLAQDLAGRPIAWWCRLALWAGF